MNAHAKYTSCSDDILPATRMHRKQTGYVWKMCGLGVFLCIIALGKAGWNLDSTTILYFGLSVPLAFLAILLLFEWNLRSAARQAPKETFEYEFTDDGFEAKGAAAQIRTAWTNVTGATLDHRGVLLYRSKDDFLFVPSRAFSSGYPRAELKALLQRKLKRA